MSLSADIQQLKDRLQTKKASALNEQQTKNYLITPFFEILGFNFSDPDHVAHESNAGIDNKSEKVDYALLHNKKKVIIVECKHHGENLDKHIPQLDRYFRHSDVKFGILTNGVRYLFFTDLENTNRLDKKPFLEVDLEKIQAEEIDELKRFHRSSFNSEDILSRVQKLKWISEFKSLLDTELNNPSDDFINYFTKKIYTGKAITQNIKNKFKEIIPLETKKFLTQTLRDRFNSIISKEEALMNDGEIVETSEKSIETTIDELELFYIIKSMTRNIVDPSRIDFKDAHSYFSIILDKKITKWFIRISFQKKFISITYRTENDVDTIKLEKKDDIYKNDKVIINSLKAIL